MKKKPKLWELIVKAQGGEEDALMEVVHRFVPLVKKFSNSLDYSEAGSDLIIWIVRAVYRYKPSANWGKDETQRYLFNQQAKKNK